MFTLSYEDMRLIDKHLYQYLFLRAGDRPATIQIYDIATEFNCHRHTAARAYRRLELAGLIETITGGRGRGGYTYRIRIIQ